MTSKRVLQVVRSVGQAEGRGERVFRSIGRPELTNLDPFLLLDEFGRDQPGEGGGFPDHPHRGFETVTYMLSGKTEHEDFTGRRGTVGPGGLQWMTAGRGIVHCEMPNAKDGPIRGLQLWVNLAREFKMVEPEYQEHSPEEIVTKSKNGVKVKVIAGESMGVSSPVRTRTPTYYLDFELEPGTSHSQRIPKGWTTFAYTLDGKTVFEGGSNDNPVENRCTVVFDQSHGDAVLFSNKSSQKSRLVLIAGKPIGEPVSQWGPFVMSTKEEVEEAVRDFKSCRNGFERAKTWVSEARRKEMGVRS